MNVGQLRKALENLPDEMPVLYAWTWVSPTDVCTGRRRGEQSSPECLLLDGDVSPKAKRLGNTVLWKEPEASRRM